ncbi:MAG: 50S ribosomal protein L10, partial [Armatimonadetes bacterium]|nr:50S ribosomal protein L10 [Armatimonadota bacterium]NIM24725.1 50S ribosomal protein L10 [Armatimonadota bacterium]NIM68605.1 50S ribosomal protein L10 [Armatimonadota bacterium]NIM77122.1 50S ribosomal protein L10 [Armatimonadota bacterium]NIN06799.1 50S ribosomal protein L10 [Armatimonadota bacterium]
MTPREETENREPRPEKVKAVGDLAERLKESAGLLLTDYRGMSVKAMGELRSALRAQGAAYQVVKNNLLRRAAEKAGCGDVVEWLEGPIAMVFLGEEIVGQTKILV